ncbi:MAG: DNA gyrase subunit A [Clostridia bacterium]|nr:DNA gyrase subunit A [Clostridia bacterium]
MAHEYDYSNHEEQVIHNIGIENEIKSCYIDYAMSVIVGRALPDVRDGMKPVHRRILYAMYEDRLTYDKPFRKSATTVGNVLGRYHPHGDASVYDAMVRLAQPFSLRYMLVEGHGNFGNIDGDPPAAYRYTEARMSKIADEMMEDIEKDVVDFMPNFDNSRKEPVVLPSRFPNLLVNGSVGIAVGMATNIPTHNLREVIEATEYLIDNPDCTIIDLMKYIKGPDFPTYGTIYGTSGIYEAYMTGRGKVRVRAKAHFEEKNGRTSIIITELPYQVNRSMLLENMVDLVKTKRVEGISDIRNESGRGGMRIVIEVKKDANAQIVLNLLYKYTQLQDTCAVNMVALVNGVPKLLNLKEVLNHYLVHRKEVVTRRVKFDLAKAEHEAHIYEGYKIAIDNIDEVISIIRASASISDAKVRLMERFGLSEAQAQAIVDMTLGKLSGMERQKIEDRLAFLYNLIKELKEILADESKLIAIIKEDLEYIKNKYGDERRTDIVEAENDILIEDLIERETCVITATRAGYVKRLPSDTYQAQRRGGKGITAMGTREEDYVEDVIISHSHDYLLMFSNTGRVYIKKCYEIPESTRTAKGTNLVNLLSLDNEEKITAILPVTEFSEDQNLVLITRLGVIKRINLMAYKTKRTNGLYAINLDDGDQLLYVLRSSGNDDIIVATNRGISIRFSEDDVREMGRHARGVRAVMLDEGDFVVGAGIIPDGNDDNDLYILTVTSNGYGKRSVTGEYKCQRRGGRGLICHGVSAKTGELAGLRLVRESEEVMLITDGGIIIRTRISEIPVYGRSASGVIVMRLEEGASVARFAIVDPATEGEDKEAETSDETADETAVDTANENNEAKVEDTSASEEQ